MGCRTQGKIDQHLADLAAAIDLILQFEEAANQSEKQRDEWAIRVITEDLVKPPLPEAMEILLQLRRFNLSFWSGGLADQPVLLLREFNTCIEAEEAYRTRTQANIEAAIAWAEKVAQDANAR